MESQKLKDSIENLYNVFSKYRLDQIIHGSPFRNMEDINEDLHAKPLRELSPENLSYYCIKAMSTVGDVNDFKHFLPRLFELIIYYEKSLDMDRINDSIIDKLVYGDWLSWEQDEIDAIRNFLVEWTLFSFENPDENKESVLGYFEHAEIDMTPYLQVLLEDVTINKISDLKFILLDCYLEGSGMFDPGFNTKKKLAFDWLLSPPTVSILEDLFYKNKEFSEFPDLALLLEKIYELQKQ